MLTCVRVCLSEALVVGKRLGHTNMEIIMDVGVCGLLDFLISRVLS